MKKNQGEIIAICYNIRSAYNIGSIFRTADGAGVDKIILGGYSASPPHPQITKTALGAEKIVPFKKVLAVWREIDKLKKEGYYMVALEKINPPLRYAKGFGKASQPSFTKGGIIKNIFNFRPKFPLVLILGNEVKGLSRNILKRCDKIVYIPMAGQKESLNVAVAFGIAIYQIKNAK